jgi:L-fuconolactonase
MWGTDWTRAVAFLTYREGVDAFRLTDRLSETEKTTLMGATLSEVYKWNPTTPSRSGYSSRAADA